MATATPVAYAAASGQRVLGGRFPAPVRPAWYTAAAPAIGQAVSIPGTAYTIGDVDGIDAWGCLVHVENSGLLYSSANGGHSDSADNAVVSIDVMDNSPAWTLRIAPTALGDLIPNAAYMADGKPVSRHGYQHAFYISQRQRVMLFGARARWSDGNDRYAVDGHNISGTHQWDGVVPGNPGASGSGYPDIRPGYFGIAHDPLTGNVWTAGGDLWVQATNTFTDPPGYSGLLRWGWQFDTLRSRFTGFQVNNGEGAGTDPFIGQVMDRTTGAATTITWAADAETVAAIAEINAAAPGVALGAEIPNYAASVYDSINDRFWLYFSARTDPTLARRFYRITPQSGPTSWSMERVTVTGSIPVTPNSGSGINGRIRYIPALGGFIVMPTAASGIYFVRTS